MPGSLAQMLDDIRRKRATQLQQIMQNSQISSAMSPQQTSLSTAFGGVNPVERSKANIGQMVNSASTANDLYKQATTALSSASPQGLSAMQSTVPAGAMEVPAAAASIPIDQMVPTAVSGYGAGAAAGAGAASGAAAGSTAAAAGTETAASGLSYLLSFLFA